MRTHPSGFFIAALASLASSAAACGASDEGGPNAKRPTTDTPEPRFVNVAPELGLDTVIYCGGSDKDHILESVGSGTAFLDYDNDGQLDIYLVNAWLLDENPSAVRVKGKNALYRNQGNGRYKNVTDAAGVGDDGWGCGTCTGDYDGDGRTDIYVTNFGPNRLYRNLGDGTFEQVAERAGVADDGWGGGATLFDADGDADLDLYVANYINCTMDDVLAAHRSRRWRDMPKVMSGPFGMRGGRDRFYRNNGDGTFSDATEESGMTDLAEGYGMGVLASDLDNDGDVDVYVANDSNPNFVYRNDGNGVSTDVGAWCGAAYSSEGAAQAGMGVDAADFDNDGLQEIFVTHFARDQCTFYHNEGDMFFEDVSTRYKMKRMTYTHLSWGCAFLDIDLDSDLDLVVVNGHIYPQVDQFPELDEQYRQLLLLMRNDGGRLTDVSRSAGSGMQIAVSARGLAAGDYDDDGDVDLLVTGIDCPPLLLRNDSPRRGHWVKLRLLNPKGSHAVNARASVTAGGLTQMREVRSGSTYQSQSAMDLHFGLGPATKIDTLTIVWPGGQSTVQHGLSVDRTINVVQPAKNASATN